MDFTIYAWRFVFVTLLLLRYLRTIVHAYVFCFLVNSTVPPNNISYDAADVTVVLPSLLDSDIRSCVRSIARCNPYQIILVVPSSKLVECQRLCKTFQKSRILIIEVPRANKREQMVAGIKKVSTAITVFSDDDVFWHPTFLSHLLSPFEDETVGAAGTNQRAVRRLHPNVWNFLGICYLERRNFNTLATNYIDGSVSTLSGRTAAYRTKIVQNDDFYDFFINDKFLGQRIKTGDDKRLTARLFKSSWKIRLVCTEEAVLYTTLDDNYQFLHQCLRWARSHWQGNIAVVTRESYWWSVHPWSAYATYLGSLMTPAIIVDTALFLNLKKSFDDEHQATARICLRVFIICTLLQKTIKIWPHFRRHPSDVRFVPAMIIFSYLHGFINIYAALTLTSNNWGGRDLN